MNRSKLFDDIEEKLNFLGQRIKTRGKLNILNLNLQAEVFYMYLFNHIFGYTLENANFSKANTAAIDIYDNQHKIIIQVSSTSSFQKIQSSLSDNHLLEFKGYTFKFISLVDDIANLKNKEYHIPHGIIFDPLKDLFDIATLLKHVMYFDIDRLKILANFLQKELGSYEKNTNLESNLTTIINTLAKEDLSNTPHSINLKKFKIEQKIQFNNLYKAKNIIEDYKVHYHRLNAIYADFDKNGVNKSFSVLQNLQNIYRKNSHISPADELFFKIIDDVQERIISSANFINIPLDELELAINIIVVDAFIRCKVFINPEDKVNNATA